MRCISNAIDVLSDHIEGGIYTEAVIRPRDIIIDRSWYTSKGDLKIIVKLMKSTKRAVAAYDKEHRDTVLF